MSRFLILISVAHVIFGQSAFAESRPFFDVSDGRDNIGMYKENSPFYEEKERGWFWYEKVPEPEEVQEIEPEQISIPEPTPEKKPEEVKPKAEKKQEGPKPLSAEWFRKNMETYRDKAIDDPSQENVETYMYLQRVMLDKAERFTDASQRVVMSDPVLDENTRRPLATFGAFAMDDMAKKGINTAAKKLAGMAGLWFFYSSTCEFCVKEAGVLKGLMNAYGFNVLPIALDGLPLPGNSFPEFTIDQGQGKQLGVEGTPSLFLVKPGENGGIVPLGTGLLAGDEIIKRAITLTYQAGWIDDKEYSDTRKAKPLTVDTKTINEIDESVMNNPSELVQKIRDNIKKQL